MLITYPSNSFDSHQFNMAETTKKQYGLILPKKGPPVVSAPEPLKKPSVFNDSDSDDEAPGDWMQKTLQKEKYGGARSRHSKAEIEKVLKDDPTAYQYDEVYDEMERTRNNVLAAKKLEKIERKPKYVQHLMATADRRKKENERRLARQIQKDREAEGDEFADKEVFVTAAYKKKLEEMKIAEEEEKRQDRLEEIGDVTKQSDLGGFYRHLFEKVVLDDRDDGKITKIVVDSDDEQPTVSEENSKPQERKPIPKSSRQYRKRKSDAELSDDETTAKSVVKRRPPLDDPPKKKTDEENTASNTTSEDKPCEPDIPENVDNPDADAASSEGEDDSDAKDKTNNVDKDDAQKDDDVKSNAEDMPPKEEKPKRSIWEKRTVGEVFDAALQRYYERKANRLTAQGN